MPKSASDAPKTLPAHAKEIWASAYNSAYDGTCEKEGERRAECAARVAWAAVKQKYEQKASGKWVKKSAASLDINELSLEELEPTYLADFFVAKTSSSDGELKWVGRASDTFEDSIGTRMSKMLFMNFIRRSEFFGMPYLGIAHYGSLGGTGEAGPTTDMWIDGSMFKARGTFHQNSLGLALYGALNTERSTPNLDPDNRIRLSLGFLDLKHSHGSFVFERRSLSDHCPFCESAGLPDTFLDGILVHLAATRVPLNARTSLELEGEINVQRSAGQGVTRFEDAASIVGESLAKELEALRLQGEHDPDVELSETVITMSGSQPEVEESDQENPIEEETMIEETNVTEAAEVATDEEVVEEQLVGEPTEEPTGESASAPNPVASAVEPVQEAISAFSQAVMDILQTGGLSRDQRLKQLQPALEEMSAAVVHGAEVASSDPQDQLVMAFRSALKEEMAPVIHGLQQVVVALSAGAPSAPNAGRRTYSQGITPGAPLDTPNQPNEAESPSQFRTLARRSVGLDQGQ